MNELAAAFDQALGDLLPFPDSLSRAEDDGSLPAEIRAEIMGMGWNALRIPEKDGGLGLGFSESMELCSVAGRRLLPPALLDEALLLGPILANAEHPAVARFSEGREPGGAGYVTDNQGEVDHSGGLSVPQAGVRLSPGAKWVVLAHPLWTAVVSRNDPAVSLIEADALDRGQGVHILSAKGARPEVIADGWMNGGSQAVAWLAGLLADLVGGAGETMSRSVSHARVREQFGRPLMRFQAVTHRLAEMKAHLELMRSSLARLRLLLETGSCDPAFLTSMLWSIPSLAREMCESAIQVHGGTGFTWEYGLHLYYRRILSTQFMLGGPLDTAQAAGRAYLETVDA